MARVFRPSFTIPIPVDSERLQADGKPVVRFRRKGRLITAPVTTTGKHVGAMAMVEAERWAVEYVDASGRPRRKIGYTDKRATEALAEELQRQVDREKAGIIDRVSLDLAQQLGAPIADHSDAYRVHLRACGVSTWHLSETMRRLGVMIAGCGFTRLADLRAEPVQRWCELKASEGMSDRTRNTYSGSLRAFVRWCVADRRLASDPLVTIQKADESANPKRVRRALSDVELAQLVRVAELRPLAEYGRPIERKSEAERKGKRDTWQRGTMTLNNLAKCIERARHALRLKPAVVARLERQGRQRALIYRTLVLTGLRRGELAELTWADVSLDGPDAWLTVRASVAKNGKTDSLPIRDDLAAELKAWRTECGGPLGSAKVFSVPKGLVHAMKADLEAAEIDTNGVDVHSLRHTTATFLAKAGVAPRTAQAIMRHSDIRLTFGTYTDPRALHPAGALDALPHFGRPAQPDRMRATGSLGVLLGGTVLTGSHSGAKTGTHAGSIGGKVRAAQPSVISAVSTLKHDNSQQRATRLERATFSLEG